MTSAGFTISGDDHPISPVMLGDAQLASDMADDMLSKFPINQRYRVLQTIQMKLILLCVWADPAVLGSAKSTLKFKYEI